MPRQLDESENKFSFVFEQPMWLTFSPCELTFKGKSIQRYSFSPQTQCVHTALSFLIRGDFAVSIVRSEFRCHQMDCRWGVQTEFSYICWCVRPSLTASLKDSFVFLTLLSLERHRPFSRKLETPLRWDTMMWDKRKTPSKSQFQERSEHSLLLSPPQCSLSTPVLTSQALDQCFWKCGLYLDPNHPGSFLKCKFLAPTLYIKVWCPNKT